MAGPKTAAAWKRFYAEERARLGERALAEMLDAAQPASIALGRVAVFPHTRLEITGAQVAAVARGVVESGAREVLALGVLHGARERDADFVKRARAGDEAARSELRRVHPTGGYTDEEFSLDSFFALVALEARRAGRPAPAIEARYPFLVGDEPDTVPGMGELLSMAERVPVVATTDPMHYGAGYGTSGDLVGIADPRASALARAAVEAQLGALSRRDFGGFARECELARSDFRDVGPALALMLGLGARFDLRELELVDYAEALSAPPPTWVAGARIDAVTALGMRAPRTAATPE